MQWIWICGTHWNILKWIEAYGIFDTWFVDCNSMTKFMCLSLHISYVVFCPYDDVRHECRPCVSLSPSHHRSSSLCECVHIAILWLSVFGLFARDACPEMHLHMLTYIGMNDQRRISHNYWLTTIYSGNYLYFIERMDELMNTGSMSICMNNPCMQMIESYLNKIHFIATDIWCCLVHVACQIIPMSEIRVKCEWNAICISFSISHGILWTKCMRKMYFMKFLK